MANGTSRQRARICARNVFPIFNQNNLNNDEWNLANAIIIQWLMLPTNCYHHRHLFWKCSFLPRLARVRRLLKMKSLHKPLNISVHQNQMNTLESTIHVKLCWVKPIKSIHIHRVNSHHTHQVNSNHTHQVNSNHTHQVNSNHTHQVNSNHTHQVNSNHTHPPSQFKPHPSSQFKPHPPSQLNHAHQVNSNHTHQVNSSSNSIFRQNLLDNLPWNYGRWVKILWSSKQL